MSDQTVPDPVADLAATIRQHAVDTDPDRPNPVARSYAIGRIGDAVSASAAAVWSPAEQVAEVRRILAALDVATKPAAPALPADVEADLRRVAAETGVTYRHTRNLYDSLSSMAEEAEIARVEEDAATGREFEAEAQAEVDAETAEVTARLRGDASSPSELAAINLLAAVDLIGHPAVSRQVVSVANMDDSTAVAIDWHGLARLVDDGIREEFTDQQWIVLPLACSLGGRPEPLSVVLGAVRRRPDPADRQVMADLVMAAVWTAMTDDPSAVTR